MIQANNNNSVYKMLLFLRQHGSNVILHDFVEPCQYLDKPLTDWIYNVNNTTRNKFWKSEVKLATRKSASASSHSLIQWKIASKSSNQVWDIHQDIKCDSMYSFSLIFQMGTLQCYILHFLQEKNLWLNFFQQSKPSGSKNIKMCSTSYKWI